MKLTLKIDGKEKMFNPPFVSARTHRRLLVYDETIDYNDMSVKDYDELVGFVRDVFDQQFTIDDFYDGIQSHELIPTILDVFFYVRTGEDPEKRRNPPDEDEEGNETGE